MSLKLSENGQLRVLKVEGDFAGDVPQQAVALIDRQCAGARPLQIVADMSACPYLDSQGLETLLSIKRRCEESTGKLMLAGVDANCRKILELTRLESRFERKDDLESAFKAMR
jgi:anti-anti-sigma factor